MKKIIFYQSHFCQIGGVETFAYNWCWWLRNYFDVTVLYCDGEFKRLKKMSKLVKVEKYDKNKTYECDIFIRNSVWGLIPKNIKAKRMIEMRHANYKHLLDKGKLYDQYHDMGIKEIVACGDYVNEMSRLVLKDEPTTIKNILLPRKKTNKVLKLISCTRIDAEKGWYRMLKLVDMLRDEGIKFEWNIFTNSMKYRCDYEEIHFWKQRYDIWDYLADADYTVLLSDSEGLPYTVQESLEYQVPCIVTDVGGCTELIKDGVNGYVVPLDMNFDVRKILKIPKCPEYENNALEDWLKYLEYDGGKIDKEELIKNYEEEKEMEVLVEVLFNFVDVEANNKKRVTGDIYKCPKDRADYLVEHKAVKILEEEVTEEVVQEVAEGIVEEAKEQNKKVEEIVKEIRKEAKQPKPKKKSK